MASGVGLRPTRRPPPQFAFWERGSPGRTRTCDPAINSRLLYQLSYRGSGNAEGAGYYDAPGHRARRGGR